jgi:hypothetical protein
MMKQKITPTFKRPALSLFVVLLSGFLPFELAHALDLTVTNVEVTQAIQTPTNTIQLVAQRGTAVRATIGVTDSPGPVAGVTGVLHVFVNGVEITPIAGVPPINAPMTAPLVPQRANENDTLNFELLAPTGIAASNDVDFRVDVTPVPGESNTDNNSGSADNLTFVDRTTPLLFFTRINYTPSGLGLPADALIQPGVGDAFVQGILPVNDADPNLYQQGLFPSLTFTEDANGDGILDALGSDGNDLLSLLASCRQLIVDDNMGASDRIFLYGWLAGNPIDGNGLAQVGGRNAFGNTDPIRHQRSYAHELTHNFGFNHINNMIDQVGWDVGARLPNNPAGNNTTGRVKPTTLFDIQVAGLFTAQAWIETAKYNSLLSHPTLTTPPDGGDFSERVLVIQGIFDPTGTELRQLKPVFRYPWLSRPTASPSPPPPPRRIRIPRLIPRQNERFTAQVIDVNENVITVPFDPQVADDPDQRVEEEIPGVFEVMIPLSTEVASLDIFNVNGARVGGFVRSQPPTVGIVEPLPGTTIGRETRVIWEAEDPDTPMDQLLFQVAYSPDNGSSFVPVAVDQTGNEAIFDATQVAPSRGTGLIRVFVSDGLNTSFADVAELSTNEPPDCTSAFAEPSTLWPPNHRFAAITVNGVTDPNGDPVTITIDSIFQDEPVKGGGSGNTCPDANGVGTNIAMVRAERDGTGNGRVYHISFTADDGRGGTCTGEVTACIPHDQGRGSECVDGGPRFDSTICP